MIGDYLTRSSCSSLFTSKSIGIALLLGLLNLSGCGGGGGGGSGSGGGSTTPTLQSIEITPTNPSLAAGTSLQLVATATYSDNSHGDVTTQVAWVSSNTAVATVGAATGQTVAVSAGSTKLSATLQGHSGSTSLTVTAATLVAIAVTPPSASIALGTSKQFTATGTYSDNSTQNLTSQVTWVSGTTAVATISNASGSNGLATSVTAGTSNIAAAMSGITSDPVTLTVTAATLVSIDVTPAMASLAAGSTEQFVATGTYTDNSTHDLTSLVTWTSSNTAVASISNSTGSFGLASTLVSGSSSVTAALNGVTSAAVTLNVTAAVLVSIAVTPPSPSIAAGIREQFTAMGTYTDHTTQNLTVRVTWVSSSTAVATISNAAGSNGLATPITAGATNITATMGGITSAPVTLTVTPATLVSIAVTPPSPSIALGTTTQFTATGTYTDNSTQNLTNQVTWASGTTAVATISNAAGSNGLATPITAGATNITATMGGVTSAPVTLTVTPATLVSIAVTPPSPNIALGTTTQFTATGTYIDNSTQNLTNLVTWASGTTAVATISNASGSNGLATPVTAGTSNITATMGGITSAPVTLTVTPAALVSISVTPAMPSIASGRTEQFTATGTYTDNSTQNLTTQVTWGSDTTASATISNATGSQGLATTSNIGTTEISATLGSVSGSTTLTVTAAPTLVSIAITPIGANIAVSGTEQYTAMGTYSDNSTENLTTQVTWGSGTTASATISNATNSNGLATGILVGSTAISATLGSVSSPAATLNVTSHGYSVYYTFSGIADGGNPTGSLTQGSDGTLYGTTHAGGGLSLGTVFAIAPSGVETVLHTFTGGTDSRYPNDGAYPTAGLVQGADGNFFGTTYEGGGTHNAGTIFKITPAGVETVLYSFTGGPDGGFPDANLIQGSDGNFYGTTIYGGASGFGTVFKITPAGVETVLYSFAGGVDGEYPEAGLVQGSDGNFYGTTTGTSVTSSQSVGSTVFKITPAGVHTVIHVFAGGSDGNYPEAALTTGSDGNFYGTTFSGGANNDGTVFKITPAGAETVLYSFTGGADGRYPKATLILGTDGNFYGTNSSGSVSNFGTVFNITPADVETPLYSFAGGNDGTGPGSLIQGIDGYYYGTSSGGGGQNFGTVFRY